MIIKLSSDIMLRGLTLLPVVNKRHVARTVWGRSNDAVCVIGTDYLQMTRAKLVLPPIPCLKPAVSFAHFKMT